MTTATKQSTERQVTMSVENLGALRGVSEVVAKLSDAGYADTHSVQVDKGFGKLTYIEWHEAVRMLDEVFGPFGWSAEITGSNYSEERETYTVDLTLTVSVRDETTGEVLRVSRPGRGVGIVSSSSSAEHDRQAHGAKSDALVNATKALGDGFGLHFYKRSAPNAQPPRPASSNQSGEGGVGEASAKQVYHLKKNGWSEAAIRGLDRAQVKAVMDGIFGAGPVVTPPASPVGDDFPL